MNSRILHPEVQTFININLDADLADLALKGSPFPEIPFAELAQQIESKRRAEKKLPTWFNTEGIYWPNKRAMEQSSSEKVAKFKAGLVGGETLVDVTGGMGVDSWAFTERFENVVYIERDKGLKEIAEHNFKRLERQNVVCNNHNGLDYVSNMKEKVDCIYIDPDRRHNVKGRVKRLEDCRPNLLEHWDVLCQKAEVVMAKLSPLLDISYVLKSLSGISSVYVVAVQNEVKEVLAVRRPDEQPGIRAVNLLKSGRDEYKRLFDAPKAKAEYTMPQQYLYECNAAIMKAQLQDDHCHKFSLCKLHPNSHLFTSDKSAKRFQGKCFEVLQVMKVDKKELAKVIPEKQANFITRNFPLKANELAHKLDFREGGNIYVIGTTLMNSDKCLIIARLVL